MNRPPHAQLHACSRALDGVAAVDSVARSIPAARSDVRDQLVRAAASIVLNIAEGAAEFSQAEKARFYRIARRSAAESLAALDVLDRVLPAPLESSAARAALDDVMAMTTRLIQAAQGRR